MEEERDVVVFADDDGNEIELDVVDYFEYEGQEYAVLMDFSACQNDCCQGCEDCEEAPQDIYIMKIVVNGDMEEFLPIEDENLLQDLANVAEERLMAMDFEDEDEEVEQ